MFSTTNNSCAPHAQPNHHTTPPPPPVFPFLTQTLAGLVVADHPGGRVGAERMTTRQVVAQYIAPRTAGLCCRFADILPESCVGLPRYHVSHRCVCVCVFLHACG